MSKGKKRSGARPGRTQPLRGTKGKRKGARFFYSSRKRHTRYWRDWSSDVCSSDLAVALDRQDLRQVAVSSANAVFTEVIESGFDLPHVHEIGRASCRERVWYSVHA